MSAPNALGNHVVVPVVVDLTREKAHSAALLARADLAIAKANKTSIRVMQAVSHSRTLDEVAGVEDALSATGHQGGGPD